MPGHEGEQLHRISQAKRTCACRSDESPSKILAENARCFIERGMSAMMPLNIQGRLARGYSIAMRRRHCPGAVGTALMTSRPGCAFSCRSRKAELSLVCTHMS